MNRYQINFRDRWITSRFNSRYNKIKQIEEENRRLAQRLYKNKPSISSKRLEDSFKSHWALKKRMSRFSQSGKRKSMAMWIIKKGFGTNWQLKRINNTNSVARTRPTTGALNNSGQDIKEINVQNIMSKTQQ